MKILDFIKRGMHGYTDSDVYDFDIWFINTIPKMLQELVENTAIIPNETQYYTEWKQKVNEIIDCFKEVQKIDNIPTSSDDIDVLLTKRNEFLDKGLELLKKYFNELWAI